MSYIGCGFVALEERLRQSVQATSALFPVSAARGVSASSSSSSGVSFTSCWPRQVLPPSGESRLKTSQS